MFVCRFLFYINYNPICRVIFLGRLIRPYPVFFLLWPYFYIFVGDLGHSPFPFSLIWCLFFNNLVVLRPSGLLYCSSNEQCTAVSKYSVGYASCHLDLMCIAFKAQFISNIGGFFKDWWFLIVPGHDVSYFSICSKDVIPFILPEVSALVRSFIDLFKMAIIGLSFSL